MKTLLSFFLLLTSFCAAKASAVDSFYHQTITVDERLKDEAVLFAISDLQLSLQKATGKTFRLVQASRPSALGLAVFLAGKESSLSTAELKQLNTGSIEGFILKGNKEKLSITSIHPYGLSHGIYTYLEKLGFRWYFPGERWMHVPKLASVLLNEISYKTPSFDMRTYFGTGSFASIKSLDPTDEIWRFWGRWGQRNRMGGDVTLEGHYGELFNVKHRRELEQHPEFLALINGKRVPWSESAKHCISNKSFQKLYITDRTAEAKEKLQKSFGNEKITVSVEPSDGGGDCECSECRKIGSPSDRYFFLANEVARQLKLLSSRLYANLFAYNTHAAPPTFAVLSNVIVQIIPYVYQSYASPQKMIADWRKKGNPQYIYDYYGVTDWHYNTPLTNRWSTDTLVDHIRFWKQQKLRGFRLESSYSIGGAGWGLYKAAFTGWNLQAALAKEEALFFQQMFGSSAGAAKQYYQKLDHGFSGMPDAVYLLNTLQAARLKEKDNTVKGRLLYLQGYLYYLLLNYEWNAAKPEEKEKRWQSLITYIWQLYNTGMVHSTRLGELFVWNSGLPEQKTKEWSPATQQSKELGKIKPITDGELQSIINAAIQRNPLLEDFAYNASDARKNYSLKAVTKNEEPTGEGLLMLDIPRTYIYPSSNLTAQVWVKVNIGSDNNKSQVIEVTAEDTATHAIVYTTSVPIDATWKKVVVKLPVNKIYRLILKPQSWIRLYVPPSQWLAFVNIPSYAVLYKLWFWVPAETKYLYFSNTEKEQPLFLSPDNRQAAIEKVNDKNLYRITINKEQTGKWWSIDGAQYKALQFFNKPDLFFLHPNYTIK